MTQHDIVIIGGGPAGMAAAVAAYDKGVTDIVILDRDSDLGGILQQCIHDGFGLHRFGKRMAGTEYAQEFIDKIEEHLREPLSGTYYTWYVGNNFDKVTDKFIIDNYKKFDWRNLKERLPADVYEHFKGLKKD